MSLFDRIAFNILFNTALSFLGGLFIVFICIQLFRVKSPTLKLYLYTLPFLKVIVDVVRGIPPESYLWSNLNFYSLPDDIGRRLSAKIGASEFGPMFALVLSIGPKEDLQNMMYTLSLPDVVYTRLIQTTGNVPVKASIFVILFISLIFVTRRIASLIKFEIERRHDRRVYGNLLETASTGKRLVDVYLTPTYKGSPFTGGIIKPYICFPEATYERLSHAERRSVIGHELMHVRHFDIMHALFVKVLGDLFWFIPLYKFLSIKVDDLRELVADRTSVLAKEDAASLASALLKLKEVQMSPPDAALYSAFAKRRSLIYQRIHLLIDDRVNKRTTRSRRIVLGLFAAFVTSLVMSSTFVGNYQFERPSKFSQYMNDLVQKFIRS